MKIISSFFLLFLLTLAACSSASSASYQMQVEIEPFSASESGPAVCCKVTADIAIENGKDIDSVDFGAERTAEGTYKIWLKEEGVNSSTSGRIRADAISEITSTVSGSIVDIVTPSTLEILAPAAVQQIQR